MAMQIRADNVGSLRRKLELAVKIAQRVWG
jgi:hypothetical protein